MKKAQYMHNRGSGKKKKDSENGGNKELIAENFSKKGMNPHSQEQTKSQARF